MRRLFAIAAISLIALAPGIAAACQPPRPPRDFSDADLRAEAAKLIAASALIVDGTVTGRDSRDLVILKVTYVWKGRSHRAIRIMDTDCGMAFPKTGSRLRVLLFPDGDTPPAYWMANDPDLGGALDDHRRLDRAIDRQLGNMRPKDFATIAVTISPPPLNQRR